MGVLAFVSNQSLQGILSRLAPPTLGSLFLGSGRARRAGRVGAPVATGHRLGRGDRRRPRGFRPDRGGGVPDQPDHLGASPGLLIPALIVLADTGQRNLRLAAAGMYVVLCSSLVWLWAVDFSGIDGFLFGNAYVWIGLAMLFLLPVRAPEPVSVPKRPRLALRTQITLPSRARVPVELR